MAGVLAWVDAPSVALVAATAKTVLQLKAPTNQVLVIRAIKIFGNQAAGGTDAPVVWKVTKSTANFGTGTAVTPIEQTSFGTILQATSFKNFTVEPTTPTDSLNGYAPNPQLGFIDYPPQLLSITVKQATSWQLEATAPATATVSVWVLYEE